MSTTDKDHALRVARQAFERHCAEIDERHQSRVLEIEARFSEECDVHRRTAQESTDRMADEHEAALEAIEERYRRAMADAERWYQRTREEYDETLEYIDGKGGALVASADVLASSAPASPELLPVLRLGSISFETPWSRHRDPVLAPLLTRGNLLATPGSREVNTLPVVHALLIRLFAGVPPGKLLVTFMDPVGLAENVSPFLHLRDTAPRLINHSVRTQPQEIQACLEDLIKHVQHVNEQLLRDTYPSLLEYNREKRELAEPYRLVVILDFPINFEQAAMRHLRQLLQAGPRCGVNTLISARSVPSVWDALGSEAKEAFSIFTLGTTGQNRLSVIEEERNHFDEPEPFESDPPLTSERLRTILREIGVAARDRQRTSLDFEEIAPEGANLGKADSREELRVRLGLQAPGRPQELRLGRETQHHVLIAGTTGSGKSNLVHVLLVNLALMYAPGELEFYLVDFKSGVELQPYARRPLPGARVVAVDSEPEFGLSVLEGLQQEVERRMKLFGAHGLQNLAQYRAATGETVPRIVLVMDEFQRLFVDRDGIDYRAKRLLDDITRIGRAAGVHVVLCTQTLSGRPLLSQSTIEQLNVRIALKMRTRDESHLILGPGNHAATTLAGTGDAIYNPDGGRPERNEVFRIAHLTTERRSRCLDEIATIWRGTPAPPIRVFEGSRFARLESNTSLRSTFEGTLTPKLPTVVLGEPLAVAPPLAISFPRRASHHLLIAGADHDAVTGLCTAALLALASQRTCSTIVLDYIEDEPGFAPTAARLPRCTVRNPVETAATLEGLTREIVRRRTESSDHALLLLLFGVQRATDLTAPRFLSRSLSDDEPTAGDHLLSILDEGPPVGVHVILWCDTAGSFRRRVHQSADSFNDRIALQMSASDSQFFIGRSHASKLGDCQALHWANAKATAQKFFPYAMPEEEYIDLLLAHDRTPTDT